MAALTTARIAPFWVFDAAGRLYRCFQIVEPRLEVAILSSHSNV